MNINYVKINSHKYEVVTSNNVVIGEFLILEDGFFYFFLKNSDLGCFDSNFLLKISNKLNEINKPWQENINEFFSKQEKTPTEIQQIIDENFLKIADI